MSSQLSQPQPQSQQPQFATLQSIGISSLSSPDSSVGNIGNETGNLANTGQQTIKNQSLKVLQDGKDLLETAQQDLAESSEQFLLDSIDVLIAFIKIVTFSVVIGVVTVGTILFNVTTTTGWFGFGGFAFMIGVVSSIGLVLFLNNKIDTLKKDLRTKVPIESEPTLEAFVSCCPQRAFY